jgi:hypothetical protein
MSSLLPLRLWCSNKLLPTLANYSVSEKKGKEKSGRHINLNTTIFRKQNVLKVQVSMTHLKNLMDIVQPFQYASTDSCNVCFTELDMRCGACDR